MWWAWLFFNLCLILICFGSVPAVSKLTVLCCLISSWAWYVLVPVGPCVLFICWSSPSPRVSIWRGLHVFAKRGRAIPIWSFLNQASWQFDSGSPRHEAQRIGLWPSFLSMDPALLSVFLLPSLLPPNFLPSSPSSFQQNNLAYYLEIGSLKINLK